MSSGGLLIYLGIVVLTFFVGTLFGLFLLRWWQWLSAPSAPGVTFVTMTPEPSDVGLVATLPACNTTPADWAPYMVQAGDTLSELAAQIGIGQNRLMRANCLSSSDLVAGQVLFLPPLLTPTPCVSSPPADWGLYTVQAGDTLSGLTDERGISSEQAMRVNCLASPAIVEGQLLHLPVLPTPTPCVPSLPTGWGLHTVQTNDTLFGLAVARGITIDEVLRVNCLTSSVIQVGQQLYLPILPTPTPTDTPTATATAIATPTPTLIPLPISQAPLSSQFGLGAPSAAAPQTAPVSQPPNTGALVDSNWNKRDETLNPISIALGNPGGVHLPCQSPKSSQTKTPTPTPDPLSPPPTPTPWISVSTDILPPSSVQYDLEQGQREYYYACNFPDPATLTARIIGPEGSYPLNLQLYLPLEPFRFGMRIGQPQGVVAFNAVCDSPLSSEVNYTLVIEDRQGGYAEQPFKVKPSTIRWILTVPQAGPPGTDFQVYYCGFTGQTDQYIDSHLFYDTTDKPPPPNSSTNAIHATSWIVFIDKDGQGKFNLPSLPGDPTGRYIIRDRLTTDRAEDIVWMLPNR